MTIEVVASRADWPEAYRTLAARIRGVAPRGARLHHIGSTAVPGLVAKDVIDIQLSVASLDEVDAGRLAAIGFAEREGLRDHAPPRRDLAPRDLAKRFFAGVERPANLHVRAFGRFNQRYPLLCRDYLRAHPAAAAAYGEFKLRLAAFVSDRDAYADTKDPVSDLIMSSAEDWAERSGWREPTGGSRVDPSNMVTCLGRRSHAVVQTGATARLEPRMSGPPHDMNLSTTIEISGEAFGSEQARLQAASQADARPVLRCDLPLPTHSEMADDGGVAALIACSRKLSDENES